MGTCIYDEVKLGKWIEEKRLGLDKASYTRLSEADIGSVKFLPLVGHLYTVRQGGDGNFILNSGWSALEAWGVWTEGRGASLLIPCLTPDETALHTKILLKLNGFAHASRKGTKLVIDIDSQKLFEGFINNETQEIKLALPESKCSRGNVSLRLYIVDPASPHSLSGASDKRLLGVGLTGFKLYR